MKLKPILSDEKVNVSRQVSFDLMKAMSIFFMISIHIYEEISVYPDEDPGVFGEIIEFLGGPLAAPLFMIAMGLGIVFSSHRSPKELFNRGLHLFIFSYILNFVRDTIRILVCEAVFGSFDAEEIIYNTFNIDILQFAGLSFMFTALLKKLNINLSETMFIAIAMQVTGNFLLSVKVESTFLEYFLGLFMYTSEVSCFPLLLWYIYPVIGMMIGRFLKQVNDQNYFHRNLLRISLAMYIALRGYVIYSGSDLNIFFALDNDTYYKQNFLSVLYTLTLFGVVKSIAYFLCETKFMKKIQGKYIYIGNHLNEIYINQWIIIGWLGFLFEFEIIDWLDYAYIFPLAIIIYIVAILLADFTGKITKKIL